MAANLFWDNWQSLTKLFMRINNFLTSIASDDHDPAILTHWAGVRFLLDSQRAKVHERRNSRCFKRVDWTDIHLVEKDGWYVLDYNDGQRRRQRGAGDDPGRDAGTGHARACPTG